MSRKPTKQDVLRALFARSGNQCAFPGCTAPLINEKNQFVAQVCHIEAAEPGGERYNPSQTDEDRRGYDNLLILCYPHHVETDDVKQYSTQTLKEMKANHEQQCAASPFKIDESLLYKIAEEMSQYWSRVEELHRDHVIPELAIEIDAKAKFVDLASEAKQVTQSINILQGMLLESDARLVPDIKALLIELGITDDIIDQHDTRIGNFQFRNWEELNIYLHNNVTKLNVILTQMELRYLELHLQLNPHDKLSRMRLDALKKDFEEMAISWGYAD